MLAGALVLVTCASRGPRSIARQPPGTGRLDPAAWGSDHVGRDVPQYMESGQCLFCHRNEVGGSWQTNKHNRTIREPEANEPALAALRGGAATKELADEVELILGDTRAQRFLKRAARYGKLDLLSVRAVFGRGRRARLEGADKPHWDGESFAVLCAGCHTTAVNPETHAFATVSLDCFSCHGDASEEHANDAALMPLAKARKDPPAVVTSICASCHVRFGKSRSSGLPYANNFVAGDNLFKDFEVDFDKADDEKLNPADRHVMRNVRDVVLDGRTTMTCLACHDVHAGSSRKHRDLPVERICLDCHDRGQPIKGHKGYEVHSQRCQY
jgi:predicted CXXCH cytochrome family protein